jgi:hypothetical protein
MKTPFQLHPLPARWFCAVVLVGLLAALGLTQRAGAHRRDGSGLDRTPLSMAERWSAVLKVGSRRILKWDVNGILATV